MVTEEEEKLFQKIKKKIQNLVEKTIEDAGYDKAYFEFKVDVYIWDIGFNNQTKYELLDETNKGICSFCGKETKYFDVKLESYLCAKCFSDIYGSSKLD